MISRLLIVFILLTFICCNSYVKHVAVDRYTLITNESIRLHLDSLTGFASSRLQNIEIDNKEYLYVLYSSGEIHNISIFDLELKVLERKIYLSQEGPNAVPNPFGIFVLNPDSIFVHARPYRIYLLNRYGSVKDWYNTSDGSLEIEPSLMVSSLKPVINREKQLYFCAELIYPHPIQDHTKIPTVIKLNPYTKSLSYPYYRTEKFNDGQWGMGGMHTRFYQTYNEADDLMVHSHGNDEYIYVYDEANKMTKYYAGSADMKEIKPFSKTQVIDAGESHRYEATTGAYEAIKYDPYRQMYYRFAFLPVEDIATQHSVFYGKIAIIILDRNFQKVGEYILPKGYDHTVSFVGKAGLHIASRAKYGQDENFLTFDIFVPVEK